MITIVNDFLNLSNFQQAWLKVKENNGCAGVDAETIVDILTAVNGRWFPNLTI